MVWLELILSVVTQSDFVTTRSGLVVTQNLEAKDFPDFSGRKFSGVPKNKPLFYYFQEKMELLL
jgi:hypothetical protein